VSSRSNSKDSGNDQILGNDISSFGATELPFANHVHYLKASKGPPSRTERAKPQAVSCTPFNESVILLDDVIEIRYRSTSDLAG
jgi:hypothetical protein